MRDHVKNGSALLVFPSAGSAEKGRGRWDRRQLEEIPQQANYRHTAKELPKPHVVFRSKLVGASAAKGEPVRYAMQQDPRNLAQLIQRENAKSVQQSCHIFLGGGRELQILNSH